MTNSHFLWSTTLTQLALVALLLPLAARADELLVVEESGVWGPTAPTTAESAPNESWSYSFLIDSNPSVTSYTLGESFFAPFSDFTYMLNGSLVDITAGSIGWGSTADEGLIGIDLTDGDLFSIDGAQAYSGPESSPTILTGVYPLSADSLFCASSSCSTIVPLTGDLTISAAAPEPGTIGMMLMSFAIMAGLAIAKLGGLSLR